MPDAYATWDDAIADGNVTDESDGYPDTYIVPLIQDLRSIGITTLQSCAGHVGKSDGELWIKDGPGVPQAMEWLNENPDIFTYIKLVYWPELRWEIGWFPKDASQAISMIRKAFIYCERGFDQYLQASHEADPDGETDGVILRREYIDDQGNTHFSMNDAEGYPVDSRLYNKVKQQNADLWDLVLKVAEHERDCNNACSEKAAQTFINNRS